MLTEEEQRELDELRQKRDARLATEKSEYEQFLATPDTPRPDTSESDAFANLSGFEQAKVGLAKPFVETAYGIQDLMEGLPIPVAPQPLGATSPVPAGSTMSPVSPEQQQELETLESGVHGIPALAGEVTGEIGMMALPGGAGSKAITKGPEFLRKTLNKLYPKLTGDIALSSSMEALKAPTEDLSRGERAANAAVGSLAGGWVGNRVGSLFRGGGRSDAAKRIQEELGLTELTLGQQGFGRPLERTLAGSAIKHQRTRELQDRGEQQWRDAITGQIGKDLNINVPAGRGAFEAISKGFKDQYAEVWKRDYQFDTDAVVNSLAKAEKQAHALLDREQLEIVNDIGGRVLDQFGRATKPDGSVSGEVIGDVHKMLKEAIAKAYANGDVTRGEVLKEVQESVVNSMPEEIIGNLKHLDNTYRRFATVRDAGAKASGGKFTPKGLETQLSKGPPLRVASGGEDFLVSVEQAVEVFDDMSSGKTIPSAERVTNAIVSLPLSILQWWPVRKIMSGNLSWQRKAQAISKILKDNQLTAGRASGAAAGGDPQIERPR